MRGWLWAVWVWAGAVGRAAGVVEGPCGGASASLDAGCQTPWAQDWCFALYQDGAGPAGEGAAEAGEAGAKASELHWGCRDSLLRDLRAASATVEAAAAAYAGSDGPEAVHLRRLRQRCDRLGDGEEWCLRDDAGDHRYLLLRSVAATARRPFYQGALLTNFCCCKTAKCQGRSSFTWPTCQETVQRPTCVYTDGKETWKQKPGKEADKCAEIAVPSVHAKTGGDGAVQPRFCVSAVSLDAKLTQFKVASSSHWLTALKALDLSRLADDLLPPPPSPHKTEEPATGVDAKAEQEALDKKQTEAKTGEPAAEEDAETRLEALEKKQKEAAEAVEKYKATLGRVAALREGKAWARAHWEACDGLSPGMEQCFPAFARLPHFGELAGLGTAPDWEAVAGLGWSDGGARAKAKVCCCRPPEKETSCRGDWRRCESPEPCDEARFCLGIRGAGEATVRRPCPSGLLARAKEADDRITEWRAEQRDAGQSDNWPGTFPLQAFLDKCMGLTEGEEHCTAAATDEPFLVSGFNKARPYGFMGRVCCCAKAACATEDASAGRQRCSLSGEQMCPRRSAHCLLVQTKEEQLSVPLCGRRFPDLHKGDGAEEGGAEEDGFPWRLFRERCDALRPGDEHCTPEDDLRFPVGRLLPASALLPDVAFEGEGEGRALRGRVCCCRRNLCFGPPLVDLSRLRAAGDGAGPKEDSLAKGAGGRGPHRLAFLALPTLLFAMRH